jgi:hypothetical protein
MQKAEKVTSETIRDLGEHAREAAGRTEESTTRAAEGLRDYQLKLISAARDHANVLFEYAQDAIRANSITELVELSTSHTRRQFEMMTEESRELAASAQKIATDTARPLTSMFGSQGARPS